MDAKWKTLIPLVIIAIINLIYGLTKSPIFLIFFVIFVVLGVLFVFKDKLMPAKS